MIISLVRYRRKRDTIISFVRYGEEHSSFPFWEGAGAFSTILERKEGDRHWNKGRWQTYWNKVRWQTYWNKVRWQIYWNKGRWQTYWEGLENRRFQDFSKKKKKNVDKIIRHIVIYRSCLENRREHNCGCSSMVECQPSKLNTWVRFPSPAFFAQIAQSVEQRTENPRVTGSIPVLGICHTCASGRVVLCLLAKEKVAGSIPVSRSRSKSKLEASIFF